jgi:putative ABC transport system permease protein
VPEVPVQQIAIYIGLAGLAGALASVLPARRAVRASVIAAMADT